MKAIDIALNDLKRSFRNAIALIFMFGVPLLLTGMFYLMFGAIAQNDAGFNLPRTKVIVADLDRGGPAFDAAMGASGSARSLGALLATSLESESFADLILLARADGADAARRAVDDGQAGVALIIPADFSEQFFGEQSAQAVLELYQDPTLTIGPAVVRSLLDQFMDGYSGTKITVQVLLARGAGHDEAVIIDAVQQYVAVTTSQGRSALVTTLAPNAPAGTAELPMLTRIASGIMGGMMVFYAFFTGANIAQSILKEDEQGTLARLFTTPTPQAVILTGKFLSVFLVVSVQVVVLLVLGRLIFGIDWGEPGMVAPVLAATVVMASTFGIFINSLLKSTRQAGIIFGGVLTVTGMLGMIEIFTVGLPTGDLIRIATLAVPQGWAVHGLMQSMLRAAAVERVPILLGMLAWSVVFFAAGVWRFNRRYA